MQDCIFCHIASGSVPAHLIYEDELVFAFLDICPIRPGHAQIIPREHFDYFDDLPDTVASRIVQIGQRLARGMKKLYPVERVGFVFTGGDIAHAHAHIVPMHEATDITSRRYIIDSDLRFASLPKADPAALKATAHALRSFLVP